MQAIFIVRIQLITTCNPNWRTMWRCPNPQHKNPRHLVSTIMSHIQYEGEMDQFTE